MSSNENWIHLRLEPLACPDTIRMGWARAAAAIAVGHPDIIITQSQMAILPSDEGDGYRMIAVLSDGDRVALRIIFKNKRQDESDSDIYDIGVETVSLEDGCGGFADLIWVEDRGFVSTMRLIAENDPLVHDLGLVRVLPSN